MGDNGPNIDLSGAFDASSVSAPPDLGASSSSSGGMSGAAALAQIFSTGVTGYIDSQAIQAGYQINNPTQYSGGYPGGVSTTYKPTAAGAAAGLASNPNTLLLLAAVAVVAVVLLRK